MACNEFTNALAWAKKTTKDTIYPVVVYFTKHFGYGEPYNSHKDAVHYAHGQLYYYETPSPHLKGTLFCAKNIDSKEMMVTNVDWTYDVAIFQDGTIKYDMKNKDYQLSTNTVMTTCVNNVLLTAASGSEVVTVGLRLAPSYPSVPATG